MDERPCKNRLLVQVGLLREDNEVQWGVVLKWLQKIFPMFQSADFQCLIERNIETTLSLTGDARKNFLESDVNFEFVGPICDSIGIGRTDLLEMSDFSERAQCTEITNGLMLELSNFVMREKIDTIVLVSWIRNFDPQFCSDGKIQKSNRLLKAKLKKFMVHYRNYQRTRYRSNGLMEQFLQTPFDLYSSDSETVERPTNRRGNFKKKGQKRRPGRPRLKEEDELMPISGNRHKLASVKEEYDSDEYGNQPGPVPGSKGNPNITDGESLTLLDVSIISVQKLSNVYGGKSEVSKQVSLDLLKNQYTLMLAEDEGMNFMTEQINTLSDTHPIVSPLDFLHYNTHYLLDIYDAVEQQIMSFEREIVSTTGEKLGRDNNPTFRYLVNFDESATCRYIRMASDMLSPHEHVKNSCRRHWLAFCIERNNPSKLPANVSNRFNNYFEAAAALLHHREDVVLFFSDLQALNDEPNIILDSINDDASDDVIQALLCVLAIVYCKVLGPYWQLLKSKAQYALYSRYIYCLYQKVLQWSKDATSLMEPEIATNVFLQVPLQEGTFNKVFLFCDTNADNQYGILIRTCLEKVMKVIAAITEENLKDFLPGGVYCQEPSAEVSNQLMVCTFSHLMGEYPFGQAFPYKNQRPDLGPPPQSSRGMLLGQRIRFPPPGTHQAKLTQQSPPSVSKKPFQKQVKLLLPVRTEQREDFTTSNDPPSEATRETILMSIEKNGGPCRTKQDVDKLLTRLEGTTHAQKREAIRCELGYHKVVLGSRNPNLINVGFSLTDMVSKLKMVLPNDMGYTSPTEDVDEEEQEIEAEEEEAEDMDTVPAAGIGGTWDKGLGNDDDHEINVRREGLPLYQNYREMTDPQNEFLSM